MPKALAVIISDDRTEHSAQQALRRGLLAGLSGLSHLDLAVLPHLYDLAPDGPGMQCLRAIEGDMVVLAWLYPRATFWVLDANDVKGRMGRTSFFREEELPAADQAQGKRTPPQQVPDRTIWCIDMRTQSEPEPLLEEVARIAAESTGVPLAPAVAAAAAAAGPARVEEATRPRWYPVVDYNRCNDCLECLNFCLFGVFGLDEEGRLLVEQPDACRDGCPACARVCPAGAIMFPQHHHAGIAGDPQAAAKAGPLDLAQLFADPAAAQRALEERQQALAKTPPPRRSDQPTPRDDFDALVDELDKSDL